MTSKTTLTRQWLPLQTDSLESLQCQVTSLAGVALQNWKALDLLNAEQGGACVLLGEKCCIYVNESELIKQDIQMLKEVQVNLWAYYTPKTPNPWYFNSFVAWVLPLLGCILAIGVLLLLASSLIQFLKQQVSSIAKITTNQDMVQYQTVSNIGDSYSDDTSPLQKRKGGDVGQMELCYQTLARVNKFISPGALISETGRCFICS